MDIDPGIALQPYDTGESRRMMSQIMTVLGPISPSQLGVTQMHEHLMCNQRASHRLDGLMNNEPLITAELATFKQAGGQSIADLTNNGIGRDPAAIGVSPWQRGSTSSRAVAGTANSITMNESIARRPMSRRVRWCSI